MPMALSNGAGAEVQRPLATVVIGGLLIVAIAAFVVPFVVDEYLFRAILIPFLILSLAALGVTR